jgi:hypothetical protein
MDFNIWLNLRGILQMLGSRHPIELEVNLVVQRAIAYVMGGPRFTFSPRPLL